MCTNDCAPCLDYFNRNLESIDDAKEIRRAVQVNQPDYKSICETAVRAQATNNDISGTCQTAVKTAECKIYY
jgi:hypothetical protein